MVAALGRQFLREGIGTGREAVILQGGLPGKVNQLLQHVEQTWEKVSDDPADATNNVTEWLIGPTYKICAKTMRGFKSSAKVLGHPYLASFIRGEGGICDLRKVIQVPGERGTLATPKTPTILGAVTRTTITWISEAKMITCTQANC